MADLRCYLTTAGIAAENNAKNFGTTLKITEMVFDGSYLADEQNPENLTDVINPVLIVPCASSLSDDGQTLTFKGSILVEQGGFNVWGIGLKTDSGVLYGYARSKGDKILTEDEGATESVRYAIDIITKNADVIEIKINQSTVYADLEDVDRAISEHEAEPNPHPQYFNRNELLRALAFTPVFNAGVGYVPNLNLVAPSVGQKCYVSEYETAWSLIQAFDNLTDEAIKAASITDGSKTYAAYWGTGTDEIGAYFTTPAQQYFMQYKAAGVYGDAGAFKDAQTEDHAHVTGFSGDSSALKQSVGRLPENLILPDGDAVNNFLSNIQLSEDDDRKILISGDGSSNGIYVQHVNESVEEITITGSHLRKNTKSSVINELTDSMGAFLPSFIWLPKGVF